MTLRPARPEDAAAIAAIWTPYILDTAATFNSVPRTEAEVAALIAGRPAFELAEADGRIDGFATYGQFRGGIGYAHAMEHTIILRPGASGRGLGRDLLGRIEALAGAAGAEWMIAGVSGENAAALRFHRRMGYGREVVLPRVGRKFGRWMDLHLLQKHLGGGPDTGAGAG